MKIIFAGTTTNAVDVLRYLHEQQRHEIVAVVTREDAAIGRKKVLSESAVAHYANAVGLNVIKANRIGAEHNQKLAELNADLGLVIAYGALLRTGTLALPASGWLNIHYSVLPKLRGAAPVQRALMQGEKSTGVTIFKLDEGMDTGDVLSVAQSTIEPNDNSVTLLDRLTNLAISMLDESLAQIESGIARFEPQQGQPSLAPKLSRDECKIDWNSDSTSIENLIRGAYPEPTAWCLFDQDQMRIIDAKAYSSDQADHNIGAAFIRDSKALVQTGSGLLELIEVQPASKNVMRASDWLRGKSGMAQLS